MKEPMLNKEYIRDLLLWRVSFCTIARDDQITYSALTITRRTLKSLFRKFTHVYTFSAMGGRPGVQIYDTDNYPIQFCVKGTK